MKRLRSLLILIVVTLAPIALVHSEIYRWVDENGKVHFADRKPTTRDAEDVTDQLNTVNVTESQGNGDYGEFFPETPQEKAAAADQRREKQKEVAHRQKNCALARSNLKKIQGPVIFEREDGSLYDVSEQERVKREGQLQKAIKKFCK
jgi:hypothetical protein